MRLFSSSVLLFCLLLLGGCYTEKSISRDELAPDDRTVCFYLADGSFVKSSSGKHHRAEGGAGYEVTGILVKMNQEKDRFEGTLEDSTITRVAVERINWVGTSFMAIGAVLVVAGAVFVASPGALPRW